MKVKVNPRDKRWKTNPAFAEERQHALDEENQRRQTEGKKPLDLSEWGKTRKQRFVFDFNPKKGRIDVVVRKGAFADLKSAELALRKKSLPEKISLAREGTLHSTYPSALAAAGIVVIGKKYIMIPRRLKTAGIYPEQLHYVGGMSQLSPGLLREVKSFEKPHETASREIKEELGNARSFLGRSKWQFLNEKLKPVAARKAKALTFAQGVNDASTDVLFLNNVNVKNPDAFLDKRFERKEGGRIIPKKGTVEKAEMSEAFLVPFSSAELKTFMQEHAHEMTAKLMVSLNALHETLQKNGK